ncbi:MAG TPA: GNAT family N-acetyltransferase [Streptosporangiaceae bacterium]|nr:GNAT family N-acetyltransferase [Streptosporangiaceae bacterium]
MNRPAGDIAVASLAEDEWRVLREARLDALADAPEAFAAGRAQEASHPEQYWRTLARTGGIFVATAGGTPVGIAAGVARQAAGERGLAAMWVAPSWRGTGAADALVAAVATWARAQPARRLSLWVPADNPRARRFYARQGFALTGRSRPFPGRPGRRVQEMILDL